MSVSSISHDKLAAAILAKHMPISEGLSATFAERRQKLTATLEQQIKEMETLESQTKMSIQMVDGESSALPSEKCEQIDLLKKSISVLRSELADLEDEYRVKQTMNFLEFTGSICIGLVKFVSETKSYT